jgi:tripartite-type tricarboxylate transporter receptor subunit TctC
VESGKALGLMVGSKSRWALMPTVPSAPEAGMPDFNASSWTGVVGPAGIPADIVNRLAKAYNDAANSPAVKARLEATGWVVLAEGPADMAKRIRADMDLYRPVIREANIQLNQ